MPFLRLFALALVLASVGCAVARPSKTPLPLPLLLWVGAHPDDELFAAPLLSELCGTRYRCRFLVLTRGERGACRLSNCGDLAVTRAAELLDSAALFDARVEQWRYSDGTASDPGGVLQQWSKESGDCATLLVRMKAELLAPRIVVTFDRNNGVTHHPDHRATSLLVQAALAGIPDPPALYTLRNEARLTRGGSNIELLRSPSALAGELVSQPASWAAMLSVADRHPSQFDSTARALLRATPQSAQTIVASPQVPAAGTWCRVP